MKTVHFYILLKKIQPDIGPGWQGAVHSDIPGRTHYSLQRLAIGLSMIEYVLKHSTSKLVSACSEDAARDTVYQQP